MKRAESHSIVALDHFIEATRDSGYKNPASAVAELIDNSFEAIATEVNVCLYQITDGINHRMELSVSDNGTGMLPSVLRIALRFGGSTRFNSRNGVGRYGMGLPNSSLSQARRVDVYSWTSPCAVWWTYLDVDEIAMGKTACVPQPKRAKLKLKHEHQNSQSGTVVVWSKCDRLNHRKMKTLIAKLHFELGRLFRHQIWQGKSIKINGETVQAVDPLFLSKGNNLVGAIQYGPVISYDIAVPSNKGRKCSSVVHITFAELPVEKWHALSNEEKRKYGISKNAGVSIIRSGRQIDYGWFFMGNKRKENYDDWWRCEVRFDAELDELFGVTHTKQGIHPTDEIISILVADIERVAHELNGRVRKKFLKVKSVDTNAESLVRAESRDYLLEPPTINSKALIILSKHQLKTDAKKNSHRNNIFPGLTYRIEQKVLEEVSFFVPVASDQEVIILLNKEHPFYEQIYLPVVKMALSGEKVFRQCLELLILAAARAECSIANEAERKFASDLRRSWSNILAAFLA